MEWRIRRQVDKARSRWRHLCLLQAISSVWAGGAVLAGLVLAASWLGNIHFPRSATFLGFAALVVAVIIGQQVFRRTRDRRLIARRIEDAYPDLRASLLAVMDIKPDVMTGRVGYLQDRVVGQVLSHAYQHGWQGLVSVRRLFAFHTLHLGALALFSVALWQLHSHVNDLAVAAQRETKADLIAPSGQFQVTVEPGNTEVERGTSLLVLARFQGPLPPDATLIYQKTSGYQKAAAYQKTAATKEIAKDETDDEGRVILSKALDDPLFGGSISSVDAPLEYYVEFAGQRSDSYRVSVFEFPKLIRADARLSFPKFTSQEDKVVRDMRQITAVVGTKVRLMLELNKAVATAQLAEKNGLTLDLKATDEQPHQYAVEFVLEKTMRLNLQLVDDNGRANKEKVELVFTAIANQPPDLKLAAPGKDTQVSPLEELELKAKAFDDFGLQRVGLTYSIAGQDSKELTLAQQVAGKEKLELAHVVALENLQAEPDQLLSYYFWAEDAGPDGQVRRTESDMFFAEVRPFEEIFRQGQQPPGGAQQQQQSSPNANAAEKLAELQKEIINATWKLLRREASGKPSEAFGVDVALLVESQNSALEQTEKLAEKIQDPLAMRYVDEARKHMNNAVRDLISAKEQDATTTLRPALDAERQAYQSLLRLRAREHQVIRGQSQSAASRGSASSRSQQQLDQLQLKEQQNRYETERTAQPQEDPVEREMRQVLNRLKELARRQGDLNDRLKEIQTALQEAQTEEQKDELRRQLKRLQEEQEQMLRDTEELQARMDQPQNAQRMAESREQLENARERVRQSSEALREGMVPQAASAGARAEQDFEKLRDDFRKQTANRFQQEVRELSEQAKELDERQQRLAQQLQELHDPKQNQDRNKKSLRDTGEREALLDGLGEQKQKSNELLDRMRQTIQDAEGPQPLLAEQLYDTVRRTQQRNLAQNLETTQEAIRRGLAEPARQQEEAARNTISELRAGIDRAAQSVLEDETEALRRAEDNLENLTQQLRNELAQNGQTPGESENPPADSTTPQTDSQGGAPKGDDPKGGSPKEKGSNGKDGSRKMGAGKEAKGGDSKGSEPKDGESEGEGKGSSGKETDGKQARGKEGEKEGKGKGGDGKAGSGLSGQENSSESSEKSSDSKGGQGSSGAGSQDGQPGEGSQREGNQQEGGRQEPGQPRDGQRPTSGRPNSQRGGFDQLAGPTGGGGGNERLMAPFSGEDFRQWSDRLRDVEEMLGDPQLSAEAARIRERARALRADSKRHSAPPNWDLIKLQVEEPLAELLQRVHIEVLKRTKSDLLVPLDRDPVPPEYAEQVRKYYERLGSGN